MTTFQPLGDSIDSKIQAVKFLLDPEVVVCNPDDVRDFCLAQFAFLDEAVIYHPEFKQRVDELRELYASSPYL